MYFGYSLKAYEMHFGAPNDHLNAFACQPTQKQLHFGYSLNAHEMHFGAPK